MAPSSAVMTALSPILHALRHLQWEGHRSGELVNGFSSFLRRSRGGRAPNIPRRSGISRSECRSSAGTSVAEELVHDLDWIGQVHPQVIVGVAAKEGLAHRDLDDAFLSRHVYLAESSFRMVVVSTASAEPARSPLRSGMRGGGTNPAKDNCAARRLER